MYYLFFKLNSDEAAIKDFYYADDYDNLYQAITDAIDNKQKLYNITISTKLFGKRIDDSAAVLTNHFYYLCYVNDKCMRKNFNKEIVYNYYKQVKQSDKSIAAHVDICNTHHYLINNKLCNIVTVNDLHDAFYQLDEKICNEHVDEFEEFCKQYEKIK